MDNLIKFLVIILVTCGAIFLFGIILAFPLEWSWNYTMPYLFSLKTITWQQSYCLIIITSILIKSSSSNKSN